MQKKELELFAENSLGRFVCTSHFAMVRAFGRELKQENIDLTSEQCRILFTLFLEDGRSQQDIAHLLLQEKSSTSRLVASLERKEYVECRQGMHDARQKLVFLTEKGRALQEPCTRIALKVQEHLKKQFSADEWAQLVHLNRKLAQILCPHKVLACHSEQ